MAFGLLLAAFVAFLCASPVRDLDIWWHLKTGELILTAGIPAVDPFSYALDGRPWVDFEWLSQAAFYLAFRAGGAAGLVVLKAVLAAGAFWLAWRLAPERPLWSATLAAVAALAARAYFVDRPWLFDFPLVAALQALLPEGTRAPPSRAARWGLPALTALWANLHGGAALLAPALLAAGLAADRLRLPGLPWKAWAATLGACLAALWATPHGASLFEQIWRTVSYPGKERILDWAPSFHLLPGLYGPLLAAGLGAAWRLRRQRPAEALWTLMLAAASLRMTRNVPLYLLVAAPTIARAFPAPWGGGGGPLPAAAALGLVLGAALFQGTVFPRPSEARQGLGTIEPLAGAARFVREENLGGRMFNEYESGGYLIWALGPERKVFVDGRNAEFDPELLDLALAWHRPEAWRALDERWRFGYAVIRRHVTGAYTAKVLDESPEWALVYWDDEAMVYARRAPGREGGPHRAYALLKPGRSNHQYLEPLLDAGRGEEVLAELERAERECRRGKVNALLLKAYVLARLGRHDQAAAAAGAAVALAPERAQPRMTLGWAKMAAGDLSGALVAYEEARARVSREERPGLGADVLNNLGRVLERRGETARAARAYRAALRWNPGQADAFENLRRLER